MALTTRLGHDWSMFSRDPAYFPDEALPIKQAQILRKHMGISKATITTPYSPERFLSLRRGGVLIYRDDRQEFSGDVEEMQFVTDSESGTVLIKASCIGDEHHLSDRLAWPDPLRAVDDQTVNTHWQTRGVQGIPLSVPASTGMLRLISEQAGPGAHLDRRVSGLLLGSDPGVGVARVWTALRENVLEVLQAISIASGSNLGVRAISDDGFITYDVVVPRDLAGDIRFSIDLLNLAGFDFKEKAPTVTDAVALGQGDLNQRMARAVSSTDEDTLSWRRRIWKLVDRRDTPDALELTTAAADAVLEGQATTSLSVELQDSEATAYAVDWDLGDRVTVYVGLAGEPAMETVTDIVREVLLEVNGDSGNETVQPAIGTFDAKAIRQNAQQEKLNNVSKVAHNLVARK